MTKVIKFPSQKKIGLGRTQDGKSVVKMDGRMTVEALLSVTHVTAKLKSGEPSRRSVMIDLSDGKYGLHFIFPSADELSKIIDSLTKAWVEMEEEEILGD